MGRSLSSRLLTGTFAAVNAVVPWHRLRKYLGALNLFAYREVLREKNLHNTRETPLDATTTEAIPARPADPPEFKPDYLYRRSSDGTHNDLADPMMGAAGTRFGRNVPLAVAQRAAADPNLLEPSPRLVSSALLARTEFVPARTLNLLAAAWIQFQTHDWFHHPVPKPKGPTFAPGEVHDLPLPPGDGWAGNDETPAGRMWVRRTPDDPTRLAADDGPPTYLNDGSHWWDGSQIYGNTDAQTAALRCPPTVVEWRNADWKVVPAGTRDAERTVRDARGEIQLTADRLLPIDAATRKEQTGLFDNWWIGLSLLHALFAQEHNAIVARLRAEYPFWDADRLFHTARLINVALMAKIHTVEWTPAILGHPALDVAMNVNWAGFLGERVTHTFGRVGAGEEVSGIPGSTCDHHHVPFSLTEEFVAVYRLHPLMPDAIAFYHASTGQPAGAAVPLPDLLADKARPFMERHGLTMADVCYSFAIANPGAPVLHNFPNFLRQLTRDEPGFETRQIDLAAIDVMRDRERGVPRYNDFRQLVHRGRARTFEQITSNPKWARELRDVYGHVDRVDLMPGLYAEDFPEGFGFSDTAFRVFILMASRRLKSDRFFTTDYNANVYTQTGLDWVAANDMRSVILRHFPEVGPALSLVTNAFAPWPNTPPATAGAHPAAPASANRPQRKSE